MASARSASTLCGLCDSDLVYTRGGDYADVCWPNGLRGSEFCLEAIHQRRAAKGDVWQRLRNAFLACTVCGILLDQFIAFSPPQAYTTKKPYFFAHTIEYGDSPCSLRIRPIQRGFGSLKQGLFKLPYSQAGPGGVRRGSLQCHCMVSSSVRVEEIRAARLGTGIASSKNAQSSRSRDRGRSVPVWLGEMGGAKISNKAYQG